MSDLRYPLQWPAFWPRSKGVHRSRFKAHSVDRARKELQAELRRLGATHVQLSTNLPLRLDGEPRASGTSRMDDCGAAVYFKLKGEDRVLACDRWSALACNLWAIARHIECIRAVDRYGVGTLEQAFAGYKALPASTRPWWEVLELEPQAGVDEIEASFRRLSLERHPDRPAGSEDAMKELNAARTEALRP